MTYEPLIYITDKLLQFTFPEILLWILIRKQGNHFTFRLYRKKSTWLTCFVAFLVLLVGMFGQDFFEALFQTEINQLLAPLNGQLVFLTASLFLFSFLFVYNYLLERKWDEISWGVSAVIGILVFILFRH
ncbi:MAG: hypothetical protein AABX70_05380 [Nanoarchaeota archaeon]